MRFTNYVWPLAILVAALLAPTLAIGLTLAGLAIIFAAAMTTRNKNLKRIMQELTNLLKTDKSQQPSSALERSLKRVHWQLFGLTVFSELIILFTVLIGELDVTVGRNYALLVVVAATPLGLELTLALLLRAKHTRASETVRTAVGYAAEDAHTLLAVLALSFAGTILLDIPPALSVLQLLIITCLARPLLSGRALQATPHKIDQRWRVLFASITVYGSYIFFYIRHYLEPRHADSINPVTWQATTTALAVFITCQAALLLFNPKAPKIIVYRSLGLLGLLLLVSYVPLWHHYLATAGLAAADWVWVIVAGLFYTALCLLQRQSAEHSRKAVLALHK